jgi:hypothetical protein
LAPPTVGPTSDSPGEARRWATTPPPHDGRPGAARKGTLVPRSTALARRARTPVCSAMGSAPGCGSSTRKSRSPTGFGRSTRPTACPVPAPRPEVYPSGCSRSPVCGASARPPGARGFAACARRAPAPDASASRAAQTRLEVHPLRTPKAGRAKHFPPTTGVDDHPRLATVQTVQAHPTLSTWLRHNGFRLLHHVILPSSGSRERDPRSPRTPRASAPRRCRTGHPSPGASAPDRVLPEPSPATPDGRGRSRARRPAGA